MSQYVSPRRRPKITRQQVVEIVKQAGHSKVLQLPFCAVMLRGYYARSMGPTPSNDRNLYDDAFILLTAGRMWTWTFNTDPSRRRDATARRKGMAVVQPGLLWFKPGRHGLGRKTEHSAFRQDSPFPILRDGSTVIEKVTQEAKYPWTNLHRGGHHNTNSEGCLTAHPDDWKELYQRVTGLMNWFGYRRLAAVLIDMEKIK